MFNLLNLDPYEFEKFCKDLMEKKFKMTFKRFGKGKDDGIDLISSNNEIICQCKRYKDSSKLVSVCRKELEKIKLLQFKHYYLLTTAELNETITKSIYEIFKEYMGDYTCIIDKIAIDDFLSKEENIDVLKSNHKLWFSSSSIMDLYLNRYSNLVGKIQIEEIKNETKYFVETKAYYEAIKIIDNNGIVLIVGDPGIGKTITSRMIIRYLLVNNNNYKLTTVSNNDITKLIESVQHNDEPEIIFLDDFLGQTCLSINDTLINELKTLFNIIKIYKNKKLILNSRITILNKALYEKTEFEKLLIELNIKECLIDVNDLTSVDRARILYNLMYYNKVTKKSYESVVNNKNYYKIINHRSFSTRIVELCVIREKKLDSEDFLQYIINCLDNPKDVWKSEFDRIETCDVILMYQLYTLGNNYIPIDVLKKSTLNFLSKNGNNVERYSFEDSINRLSKSLLRFVVINKKKYISVMNPSINDYIQNYLLDNLSELKKIFNYSLYIEQLDKLINLAPEMLQNNFDHFEELISFENDNVSVDNNNAIKKKINFILKYEFCSDKIINYVNNFFKYDLKSNYLIRLSLNKKIRDFYNLKEKIINIKSFVKKIYDSNFEYIEELLEYYSSNHLDTTLVEETINGVLKKSLNNYFICFGEDISNDMINELNEESKFCFEDGEWTINQNCVSNVEEEIKNEMFKKFNEIKENIKNFGYQFIELNIDFDSAIENVSVDILFQDDLDKYLDEIKSQEDNYDDYDYKIEENISVEDIFSQEYNP